MKHLFNLASYLMLFAAAIFINFAAIADSPEMNEWKNSTNPADRWRYEQYKRAEGFDKLGKYKKASEVRKYADDRSNFNKELGDIVKQNWVGNK